MALSLPPAELARVRACRAALREAGWTVGEAFTAVGCLAVRATRAGEMIYLSSPGGPAVTYEYVCRSAGVAPDAPSLIEGADAP